jgi:effector-binding domain-containing protein/uncharacterized protein YndB with AHSA1/START domain
MPEYHVKKSMQIDAPTQKIFSVLSDFHQWEKWSPWLILEPGAKVEMSDDGKKYSWEGEVIGSGNMVLDGVEPKKSISQTVNFIKPWKSSSPIKFILDEKTGGTEVTWTMTGNLPFFMFWMKNSMSAFIGMDFQRGLLMLKDYVETGSVPCELTISERNQKPGFKYIGVKTICVINDLGNKMRSDFTRLTDYIQDAGVVPTGKFFSIYDKFDMVKGQATYIAGIPVASVPGNLPPDMISGDFPALKTYEIIHKGPYRHLGNAWSMGNMYSRAKKFKQDKKTPPFEVYENMPGDVPEEKLMTRVCFPVKA